MDSYLNGHVPERTLDELASGCHERCAWCRANFVWTQGGWVRYKALDGKYYCDPTHASAPYLTVKV